MSVCERLFMCACARLCMYMCACMCACVCVCMYVCMCMCERERERDICNVSSKTPPLSQKRINEEFSYYTTLSTQNFKQTRVLTSPNQ